MVYLGVRGPAFMRCVYLIFPSQWTFLPRCRAWMCCRVYLEMGHGKQDSTPECRLERVYST